MCIRDRFRTNLLKLPIVPSPSIKNIDISNSQTQVKDQLIKLICSFHLFYAASKVLLIDFGSLLSVFESVLDLSDIEIREESVDAGGVDGCFEEETCSSEKIFE